MIPRWNSIWFCFNIAFVCLESGKNHIWLHLALPSVQIVCRETNVRAKDAFVFVLRTLIVGIDAIFDALKVRGSMLIPLRQHALIPLGSNPMVPFVLCANGNGFDNCDRLFCIRPSLLNARRDSGMGEKSLDSRENVGLKDEASVFIEGPAYRSLEVGIARTYG
jgi:hypothetical protein